jgi:ubiquinone biosynthesis protein
VTPLDRLTLPFRELARYRQVLFVLVRYGFGDVVEQLGLQRLIRLLPRRAHSPSNLTGMSRERRIRLVFEELGPTFVKLGQVLSTRPDLLTPELEEELSRLQDDLPAVPPADVEELLAEEFPGIAPRDRFRDFDPVPIAAASIGQVHRATLADGTPVAVKIRRPRIERQIEVDLRILHRLAGLLGRFLAGAELYDPVGLVEEFARTIRRELDLAREARQCERFQRVFAGDAGVGVPKVFWERTTSRCLTLEFVNGVKISRIAAEDGAGFDRSQLARRGAGVVLKMVFTHGVFHGDPHPGNILVDHRGKLWLLDFGIVGYLDEVSRRQILDLLTGFVRRDTMRVLHAVVAIGRTDADLDLRALRFDLNELIESYHNLPLHQMVLGQIIRDVLGVIGRHQIRLPADLAMLSKVLVELDGLGRRLDPTFNLVEQVRPFLIERLRSRLNPQNVARELLKVSEDALDLLRSLPSDVSRILSLVKENKLEIGVVHREADPIAGAVRAASDRLVRTVLAAGLVVGSAILLAAKMPPLLHEFSVAGVTLLLAGLALALRVLQKAR